MTKSKSSVTFLSIIAVVIVIVMNPVDSQLGKTCDVPDSLNSWDYYASKAIRQGKDWRNDIKTDSWQLRYSWSPTYCRKLGSNAHRTEQCRQKFAWIVHGLWAQSDSASNTRQHPRNCKDTSAISTQLLRENFCLMPDVKLMQKEWEKHGSCDFERPEQYFSHIHTLHDALTLPSLSQTLKLEQQSKGRLVTWMVNNNKKIGLKASHVKVFHRGRRLKEIAVCYDKRFKLARCGR
jgi:ribonuclease T2